MSDIAHPAICAALAAINPKLGGRSGSVFYAGRTAFSQTAPVYLLGLNPGGDPGRQAAETVATDIEHFLTMRAEWSAYRDQRWEGKAPGTHGMQPRVLKMIRQLGLDPRQVPSSNVVFVRSRNEKELQAEKRSLLDACWPVHSAVISSLKVGIVVCFGGTSGSWIRDKMNAHLLIDKFTETNLRGWTSLAHQAPDGRVVATVTHPSRADWTNPAADPTPLIRRLFDRTSHLFA